MLDDSFIDSVDFFFFFWFLGYGSAGLSCINTYLFGWIDVSE